MIDKKYVPTGDPRVRDPHVNCRCSFVHIERNPEQLDLFGKTHVAGMSFETLMEKVKK